MFTQKNLRNKKGQALLEAALIAPLIIFFLFAVIWFGRIMLTWQQITGAARYGTDLIAYTSYTEKQIEDDIRNYLCHHSNIGRTLSSTTVHIDVHFSTPRFPSMNYTSVSDKEFNNENINDFKADSIFSGLTDIVLGISKMFADPIDMEKSMSYVEISYKYKTPLILSALKEDIEIKARSEVLSGTGNAKDPKNK